MPLKNSVLPREFYPDAPENGIYILGDDAQVGEDAVHYLGLDDTVFEYEITNNRVDCYSIIGIAREAAGNLQKAVYTAGCNRNRQRRRH